MPLGRTIPARKMKFKGNGGAEITGIGRMRGMRRPPQVKVKQAQIKTRQTKSGY